MGNEEGAIAQISVLVLGIWLALPSPVGLGALIVNGIASTACPGASFCDQVPLYIIALQAMGVLVFLGDLLLIYKSAKSGHWF